MQQEPIKGPVKKQETTEKTSAKSHASLVKIGNNIIGGENFQVIAGPCSIESLEQLSTTTTSIQNAGATLLRGGIFKMRTSPNSFQGLGDRAIEFAKEVKAETGISLVSEVTDARQIEKLNDVVDLFQVGSRNMYNYALLKELGQINKPIMLKRGFSALVEEWILAAQYIVHGGNDQVILCERGIRSFDKVTRNVLDLSSVAYIKQNTDFPVVVDPSHATGVPALIAPMSLAAAAAGADGLIIEVHPSPETALSDGFQALTLKQFDELMSKLKPLLTAINRPLATSPLSTEKNYHA